MSTQINQFGKGDNIAGDKIVGDKIQDANYHDSPYVTVGNVIDSQLTIGNDNTAIQIDNSLDETSAIQVQKLRTWLDFFSQDFNLTTERGQTRIKDAIIDKLKQNSALRKTTQHFLRANGEEVLLEALNHPAAKITIEAIKSFLKD